MAINSGCVSRRNSYDAAVHCIYGQGSNIVACAADVRWLLGHDMPPVGE